MVLHGKTTIGFFNRLLGSIPLYAEDFIVISFCHNYSSLPFNTKQRGLTRVAYLLP
jgi:hypothetical protein